MTNEYLQEPMMDMFIFETNQLIEQLENIILNCEKDNDFPITSINEIFRIMHTIKGSSAMMMFNNISALAHSIEDLFFCLREEKPEKVDSTKLSDIILEGIDFIKSEMEKIKDGREADGNADDFIILVKAFLQELKKQISSSEVEKGEALTDHMRENGTVGVKNNICDALDGNIFQVKIFFEEECGMENIRAYSVVRDLESIAQEISYLPENILDNMDCSDIIKKQGFEIFIKTQEPYEKVYKFFNQVVLLKKFELVQMDSEQLSDLKKQKKQIILEDIQEKTPENQQASSHNTGDHATENKSGQSSNGHSMISVHVTKLDKLMDLVGELVISESMVTQNPELQALELESFDKAARQLHKITSELQNEIMSIRMVPLAATFIKMNRVVRDMSKKLNKEVELEIIGEETEVDKNIIEHISDPLMHLIRNAIDHGIEENEERIAKGKAVPSTVTLEARNDGGEVLILVKDNGRGLDKEKILARAAQNGLLQKAPEEMLDSEIFSLIFIPGFSTNENVTEFSGRGVGMDVVTKNIEAIGGAVAIDSVPDVGTTIKLKIPLTLAIIGGMNVRVGNARYTVPTNAIKESFRVKEDAVITDPDGNEMIMVRGQCYPILRLHKAFHVLDSITRIQEGILVMVENQAKTFCMFVDALLGEQQVVVKALPRYLKKIRGVAACTLLGDGNISLILDMAAFL